MTLHTSRARVLAVLLVGLGLFAGWLYYRQAAFGSGRRYVVRFQQAHGLTPGSTVRCRGLEVGRVDDVSPEPSWEGIRATLRVRRDLDIRKDATLVLQSDGLLGPAIIEVVSLGSADQRALDGDVLQATEPAGLDVRRLTALLEDLNAGQRLNEIDDRLKRVEEKLDLLLARNANTQRSR